MTDEKCKTLVCNLYAGPGTGKSSTMAGVFSELKFRGMNCEQAPEFAKEKVWEGSLRILSNQIYVFGKQLHTIMRVVGQVECVITDSPLLLSMVYGKKCTQTFKDLVFETYSNMWNLDIFLTRNKKYNPNGRLQDEDQAKGIDTEVRTILDSKGIQYSTLPAGPHSIPVIADMVENLVGNGTMIYK